jgi:glutamate carboxypeptidase
MDAEIGTVAAAIAERAEHELEILVGISSPSGDVAGAEEAIAACASFLPQAAQVERVPCSTPGSADDLLARLHGTGTRRLLLLGHLDTVIGHEAHQPLRRDGELLYGPGTADMKGGVALSLGVARWLADNPELFAEVALLLVLDEEWRTDPLVHVERFANYDVCFCFEAGERTAEGHDGVVVRRKAAATLRVSATGVAAHSGALPHTGRNALMALAHAAIEVAATADPDGPDRLTVVPTVMRSGEAFNVVPAAGELVFDMRSRDERRFESAVAAVRSEIGGATLAAAMERVWPAMDSEEVTKPLLAGASERLGRPIVARSRGGASDASHFARAIPLTVDGLGPLGAGVHTPQEFVWAPSLRERAEVALALVAQALSQGP